MCFSLLNFAHVHTYTHMNTHTHAQLHISQEHANTTVNELTFYHITLFTDCLKTLISYVHPQHYACVDDYLNCSVD